MSWLAFATFAIAAGFAASAAIHWQQGRYGRAAIDAIAVLAMAAYTATLMVMP